MPRNLRTTLGRSVAALATFAVAALSGCGSDEGFAPREWDAPGQNTRVGPVLIRYAHIAEPRGEPWRRGDDVPAYVWLLNEGPDPDRLVGAETPAASSMEIVNADGEPLPDGVRLPPDRLQQLEPGRNHLVLRDLSRLVRGGDFVKVTLRFEEAGSAALNMPCQVPAHDPGPSPSR